MQANATLVIADKTDYDTNEYIKAEIHRLVPIRLCNDILTFNAVPDFINAFSDTYLVPGSNIIGGVQIPENPDPHRDLVGLSKPNEGYPIVVDEFDPDDPEIIAFPNNVKGGSLYHYIVFDHCQDGKFTDREDEVKTFPLFKVKGANEDLPNLDKIRLKTSASIKLFEYERNLGIAKIVISTILSAIVAYGVYRLASNPTAAIASFIVSELSIGGFLGGFIVNIFAGWVSGATNLIEKYKRIAQDPPDFNYQTTTSISQPVNPDLNPHNPFEFKSIQSIIQYTYDLNNEAALAEGLLHSIERYDGSFLNGDPAWSVIHAKEIKKYSLLLKDQIIKTSQTVDNLIESIKNDTIFPNESEKSEIEILRNAVRQQGWNSSNILQMKNLGLDDDQIANITSQFLTGEIFTKNQFADLLKNTTSTDNLMIAALDDLVDQADQKINNIISKTSDIFIYDYLPIANAGGPYSGFVNDIVSFNGSASHSSSLSNITKYEWDLNSDGKFDDSVEQSPQIRYNYPFKGLAGLKVTNQDGWSDISYNYVNITDTNNAPIINEFSPADINQTIILNNNILFSITATDLDINDNISIDWLVDNTTSVINSQTFNYTPTADDIGIHIIQAKVSDFNTSNSTDIKTWVVKVLDVDSDMDSWNDNADCNDNNSNINPGAQEIRYNGIDEDCNPQTLDGNSPPVVQNKIHTVLQNSTTTNILLQGSDIDNDPLKFIVIDKPENGVVGPIITNSPSSASISYTPNVNFHGTDKLTFIANDGDVNSTIGTVSINIWILTSPLATSKTITIDEDTTSNIELEATNKDGHQLQFSLLPQTSLEGKKDPGRIGTLTIPQIIDKDSAITRYTPFSNYQSGAIGMGVERILFNVVDPPLTPDQRSQSNGQITININPVNDPPSSFSKIVKTIENTPIDIFLRANDVENDFIFGDRLNHGIKFFVVEPPVHGILGSIQENVVGFDNSLKINKTQNWVKYTPSPGFSGEDHFSFIASDGNLTGNISDIKILVAPQDPVVKTNFVNGDLLVNGGSKLLWLDPDGTANKKSNFLSGREPVAGGAFDGAGNVYIPEYNGGVVSKFNLTADLVGPFGDRIKDYDCRPIPFTNQVRCDFWPTAITFDKNGNGYIGGAVGTLFTGQPRDSLDDIRKFDSNGNLVQKFDVDVLSSGIFGLELDADQCTLYYSSWEGSNTQDPNKDIIKRFDVCENKQLTDFANIFQDPLYDEIRFGHQVVRDFKLLPDGGMIVAHNALIQHLDSSGKIVKTYDIAGVGNWESIALDADGNSFWAGGDIDLFKIEIATGKVLQFFELNAALPRGIMVYGEPKPSLTEISPMVIDQNVVVNQNIPVPINLTGFDINNDPLTFSIIEEPIFGTLSSNIDQITNTTSQITYTPNSNFDEIDSFTFIANDGKLNSTNIGTIMIAKNHAPVANNDNEGINTLQGVPINIDILANDDDIDIGNPILNDTISLESIDTSEIFGNLILNNDNKTITYVPFTPEYVGQDSFNYTITDRYGLTDTAKVTIDILSSNNIPVANNQTIETLENTTKIIQLNATDVDPPDTLFYQIVDSPSNGSITNFNSTTGIVEYQPFTTFRGEDSFKFRAYDGKDKSLPGIVNITVIDDGINDAPRIESERVTANVSEQITIDVLENDIDPNGDFLTLTNITGPFNGTAFLNQDQTITYQSDSNFNASDVLYYRVADQFGSFDIGQLIIDVQGNAENQIIQVPSDRLVTTTRNQPLDIELEATATIDRPVTFFIVDAPNNGILGDITTLSNLTSSVTYTPNNNFFGNDSFTYVAQDAKGITSNIGIIQISVSDIPGDNNPPIAKDSQAILDEDTSIPIQLTAFDIDLADSLTYSIESQPFNGEILDFDPLTGSLVYQPNPNFNGNDSFLFKAVDQGGLESNIATVQITVNSVNDPPVAVDKIIETNSNTSISITLEGTDIDQGDTIDSFAIISNPTNGQIFDFNSNTGILTYTPNNNFVGLDFFTFKVTDSHGLDSTNTGLVTIDVKSTQEPPNNEQPPLPLPSSVCNDSDNNTVTPRGTQGNDELVGTSQRDVITGLGGNDRFNGCSGNDTLNGNLGNDGIAGGPGNDNLHGNEGNDYLQGDSGDDFLSGNEGNDILVGNEGRDTFFCGTGHDQILDFDTQLDIKSNHCEVF